MGVAEPVQLIEPTQEILRVWQRWLLFSNHSGPDSDPTPEVWFTDPPEGWPESAGWNSERNSVMDAELLECVFLPAYSTPRLQLHNLKGLSKEVRHSLYPGESSDGDRTDWTTIRIVLARLRDFLMFHREGDTPTFHPGSYVSHPEMSEASDTGPFPEIVDSFSISISLCIQAKMLMRWWEEAREIESIEEGINSGHRPDSPDYIRLRPRNTDGDHAAIEGLLNRRLTTAMEGLRDSFIAAPVSDDKWEGGGYAYPTRGDEKALSEIKRRLSSRAQELEKSHLPLFHCGFSWGRVATQSHEKGWLAEPLPYLYFTVGALDAIADVIAQPVRAANILDDEQKVLAAELGFLYEQTSRYWTVLSRLPGGAPGTLKIEDVPWTGFDKTMSPYWTVYVLRLVLARTDTADFRDPEYVDTLVRVVEEIAQLARITRKAVPPNTASTEELMRYLARRWLREADGNDDGKELRERLKAMLEKPEDFESQLDEMRPTVLRQARRELADPALELHLEGETLQLGFDSDRRGDGDAWTGDFIVYDLAPQLLKVTGRLMEVAQDRRTWARLSVVRDQTWAHLRGRRFASEAPRNGQAWDQVDRLRRSELPQSDSVAVPSWYITERVVEALVAVDAAERSRPATIDQLEGTVQMVLDDVRWQTAVGVGDSAQREKLRARLGRIEARTRESPAVALVQAMDLARDVDRERDSKGEGL